MAFAVGAALVLVMGIFLVISLPSFLLFDEVTGLIDAGGEPDCSADIGVKLLHQRAVLRFQRLARAGF
jgi:hypothetical protein